MKALTCEMCGSTNLIKQDGVFVCQSCGTKYSVEEAKKMMVEGTVSVEGTVKLDTSKETENLLILARRAKEADNGEQAAKYYEQLLLNNPNNWEANFYTHYYRAKSCRVGEIPKRSIELVNCLPSTFKLMKDQLQENEIKSSILPALSSDILTLAQSYILGTIDMSENYNYQAAALNMADAYADILLATFSEMAKEECIKVWKQILLFDSQIHTAITIDAHFEMLKLKGYSSDDIKNKLVKLDSSYLEASKNNNKSVSTIIRNSIFAMVIFLFVLIIVTMIGWGEGTLGNLYIIAMWVAWVWGLFKFAIYLFDSYNKK